MNKLLSGLAIVITSVLLVGCSAEKSETAEFSGKTYTLQLPITDGKIMELDIPEECGVELCDGFTYWQLSNDVTITITPILNHLTSDKTEVPGLYKNSKTLSYDYMDRTITIRCDESKQSSFVDGIMQGTVYDSDTSTPDIIQLDKYPRHKNAVMKMYNNNLYMPDGAQETRLDVYTALLHTKGREFLLSWICDGKREDIIKRMVNICLANSGSKTLTSWFADDDIFFAQAGSNLIGMKKLRRNEWYIYSGTSPYKDYILTGLQAVHGGA